MKTRRFISRMMLTASLALASLFARAQSPYPITVNSQGGQIPSLSAYQGNALTIRATFLDGTNAANIATNASAYLSWASNATASAMTPATVARVQSNVFDFTFAPADLNTVTKPGAIYTIGIAGLPRTYMQGAWQIKPDPYGAGAGAVSYLTLLNWNTITNSGALPWLDAAATDTTARAWAVAASNLALSAYTTGVSAYARSESIGLSLTNYVNSEIVTVRGLLTNATFGVAWKDLSYASLSNLVATAGISGGDTSVISSNVWTAARNPTNHTVFGIIIAQSYGDTVAGSIADQTITNPLANSFSMFCWNTTNNVTYQGATKAYNTNSWGPEVYGARRLLDFGLTNYFASLAFNGAALSVLRVGSPTWTNFTYQLTNSFFPAYPSCPTTPSFIWILQGAGDSGSLALSSAYETNLLSEVSALRALWPTTPLFIVGNNSSDKTNALTANPAWWSSVREAHKRVAGMTSNCFYVDSMSFPLTDDGSSHFSEAGQIALSRKLAELTIGVIAAVTNKTPFHTSNVLADMLNAGKSVTGIASSSSNMTGSLRVFSSAEYQQSATHTEAGVTAIAETSGTLWPIRRYLGTWGQTSNSSMWCTACTNVVGADGTTATLIMKSVNGMATGQLVHLTGVTAWDGKYQINVVGPTNGITVLTTNVQAFSGSATAMRFLPIVKMVMGGTNNITSQGGGGLVKLSGMFMSSGNAGGYGGLSIGETSFFASYQTGQTLSYSDGFSWCSSLTNGTVTAGKIGYLPSWYRQDLTNVYFGVTTPPYASNQNYQFLFFTGLVPWYVLNNAELLPTSDY